MSQFARDVRAGLERAGQRSVPSMYLYDELGTALFEAITHLPEYGLTRADERVLRRHAAAILDRLPAPLLVAELGSGSGSKTRRILEELAPRQPVQYYPIDISASALARCRLEMSAIGAVAVVGLESSYLDGLREVARRRNGHPLLVLFLGSTIGNFERPAAESFLAEIRSRLLPGDAVLLGADLVKPVRDLLLAYDDPAGVTAAFNLNLLARMNRELGADFNLRRWGHEARWNACERRIEMHLRSRARQTVEIPDADFSCTFEAGETIWTEACHKFTLEELAGLAKRAGFRPDAQWVDAEWPFAESLWIAQ
jgi:dimethylhistidine N-methyltransferase